MAWSEGQIIAQEFNLNLKLMTRKKRPWWRLPAPARSWLAIPVADTMFKACCLPVPHHRVGPGPGDAEPPRRPRQPEPGARPGARTRTTEKYVTELST